MEWLSSLGFVGTLLRGLIVLIEALLVLNLLIVVHEWGHFLAARWRGLKIEKFYVWFGKPLWKKVFNGVEYGIGTIPLGGFVQLPQMGPMGGLEGEEEGVEKLLQITPMDKIIVAFAGPLFSFLLAVVFAWVVYFVGYPDGRIHTTTIGYVVPDKPGAKAGFLPGDKILSVDGTEVHSWDMPIDSVKERIAFSKNPLIDFVVQRPGEDKPRTISTGYEVEEGTLFQRKGLRVVGLIWEHESKVAALIKGSAAERAGIKVGDVITHLNGTPVRAPFAVLDFFEKQQGATAKLTLKRDARTLEIEVAGLKPEAPTELPKDVLGNVWSGLLFEAPLSAKSLAIVHPTPMQQISMASTMVFRTFDAIFKRLFASKGDVGIQQMGGPVKIVTTYTQFFQIPDGWRLVLWFSMILNVNLAIMNLIPLPVFDGGHIVMAIGERIRRGSLLPTRIMEIVQTACVITLLCFFAYVSWFDVSEHFGLGQKKEPKFKLEDVKYPAAK